MRVRTRHKVTLTAGCNIAAVLRANTFNARVVGRQAVGAGARPIVSQSFRGLYTVVLR